MSSNVVRNNPRISVNKLGEYMVARAARRRRIIEEQKRPREFQSARYAEAQNAIVDFLAGGSMDCTILTRAIDRLNATSPRSDWDAQRIDLCIEALDSFLEFESYDFISGMQAETANPDPEKLNMVGVEISVRPEIHLTGMDRTGRSIIGAVKLYIGKTIPLTEESAAYVATTVHQFLDEFADNNASATYSKCFAVDVFGKRWFAAPRNFIRRQQDIEAACQEIIRAWPEL